MLCRYLQSLAALQQLPRGVGLRWRARTSLSGVGLCQRWHSRATAYCNSHDEACGTTCAALVQELATLEEQRREKSELQRLETELAAQQSAHKQLEVDLAVIQKQLTHTKQVRGCLFAADLCSSHRRGASGLSGKEVAWQFYVVCLYSQVCTRSDPFKWAALDNLLVVLTATATLLMILVPDKNPVTVSALLCQLNVGYMHQILVCTSCVKTHASATRWMFSDAHVVKDKRLEFASW